MLTSRSEYRRWSRAGRRFLIVRPSWGCSLAPITLPGNGEGDLLKRAIEWLDSVAVPRRSRRTSRHGPHYPYSSNEAAEDFLGSLAFLLLTLNVVAGSLVVGHSSEGDLMEGGVCMPVAAATPPVTSGQSHWKPE